MAQILKIPKILQILVQTKAFRAAQARRSKL
jgi:hypothetical protein